MNIVFFPSQYKKALVNKTKNTTIRIGEEVGKYKIGEIYSARSYAGNNLGIKIKIKNIIKTTIDKLDDFDIPKRTIYSIIKKEKVSTKEKVEIMRFEVI